MKSENSVDEGIEAGRAAIAEAAAAKENAAGKKPWEQQFEREHPELAEKEAKVAKSKKAKAKMDAKVDEQVAKEEKEEVIEEVEKKIDEESEEASESESKPAKEQQTNEEDKPAEEESKNKGQAKPSLEEVMKTYAEKNGITIEEAKADFEANNGILKKYMDNPETFPHELAKAYRNQQAEYSKSKEHQKQANANAFAEQIIADPKAFINKALDINKDKLIKEFRENNPERSSILSDGAIIEELRDKGMANLNVEIQKYQSKIQRESGSKREGLMASLKETDKAFAGEIKQMLYKLPDAQVSDPNFNFKDLIRWAKGDDNIINKMIKDAEDKGYRKAMEEKRILGDASVITAGSVKSKAKPQAAVGGNLNEYQKKKAVEMFGSAYETREECYAAYDEVVVKRKK